MKKLSIFVDESGDFGKYAIHSPCYIVTMVFHDQNKSINYNIDILNKKLEELKCNKFVIHTEPLIRKEESYIHLYNFWQKTHRSLVDGMNAI